LPENVILINLLLETAEKDA